ncbi:hypothetical protein CO611_04140 [Lysobacteraceae bacterium NML03-0222]|nr:hypothetical protein CO611_04140 [Xanthomonadaceae bacterium NML03-0222]PJK06410.1 hypothetical protein CO612_02180 [Xanthomonadaceae bacterium NML71-0210]
MVTSFTPWSALLGGALIGLAALLLLAGIGRIAGISGILNNALENREGRGWRVLFLLGLIIGVALPALLGQVQYQPSPANWPLLILAGLLVGFGTRLGNGCTSGHGICGLARLSPRSLIAVLVFMGAGFISVYLLRHVLQGGWS